MKQKTEKSRQLPGHIEEEVDEKTGEKRDIWKNISDKIHFKKYNESGHLMTRWQKINNKAVEVPVNNNYFVENIDQNLLFERISATRNYADAIVWQVLKANLVTSSGLSHVKQTDIVNATKLSKSQVSEAMKRLKSVILSDSRKLPELVRECDKNSEHAEGFALNPELVIIGDHQRARNLWDDAQKQREAAVAKQVKEIIARINSRIDAGEVENSVIDDELAKVKDANVKSDVEFELAAALEDDF